MKQPDYELLHKLKGELSEKIERLDDNDLKSCANNYLRQVIDRAEKQMSITVNNTCNDLYYIKEILDAKGK